MATPAAVSPEPFESPSAAEDELVRRLKAGDDSAYEELVKSLTGRLLAVARRVTRSEADAQDAVQDAFLSAFKSIGAFDGRSSLGTWMHRIVVNAALARMRSMKHRTSVSIDALLPMFEGGMHKHHPRAWREPTGPEQILVDEDRAALLDALKSIPDEFREVLVLRDIAEQDSKSVATALGISDALVRQRLHRGRQALLTLMNDRMTEERP